MSISPTDAIWSALNDYAAMQDIQPYELDKVAEHIVQHIREHYGYIIKRAVPPCVAHSQVDPDAA